jgi:tripartite-type tricarboxylate transporter receptor subunit TctC
MTTSTRLLCRVPFLPDLPTVAEAGMPGFTATNGYAFTASGKAPPALLERWNQKLVKALKSPEVVEELKRSGLLPAPGTHDEPPRYIDSESRTWGQVNVERQATAL